MEKKVPTPQALGRSMLPKVPLSYRWVISDAEIFLKNCGQRGLGSPKFPTTLPLHKETTAEWELVIKRSSSKVTNFSLYVCCERRLAPRLAPSGRVKVTANRSKVLISNCMFSILSSATSTSKLITTLPAIAYEVGQPLENFGKEDFITNLNDYLDDGALTIQVDATILCFTDPAERLDKTYNVPPDDIRETIKSLYNNDDAFSDLTIKCADETFKAHKVILVSQSPVFRKMFEIDMKEKRSDTVEISDLDPEVLSDLLAYLYTGNCPNLSTLAKELMNVANKYQLPRLMAMCEKELESRVVAKSVIELLVLADFHQASHLKAACLKFITINSTSSIFRSEGWKNLKGASPPNSQRLMSEILEFSESLPQAPINSSRYSSACESQPPTTRSSYPSKRQVL